MQIEFYTDGAGGEFATLSLFQKAYPPEDAMPPLPHRQFRPAREYSRDGARMIEVAAFEFVSAEYWRIPLDQEAEDIRQSPRNRELHRIAAKIASGEYC